MAYASNIGKLQITHTSKRTLAAHYRRMALALQAGTLDRHTFPKAVPRGKPVEWYLTQAERLEQQSQTAGELAEALVDLNHQQWLETVGAEVAADTIDRSITLLQNLVDHWGEDWPKLAEKLTTDQRDGYARAIQAALMRLRRSLQGGER